MFEEFQKALRGFDKPMTVAISIPLDDSGYMDRQCPHKACRSSFKVMFDDWKSKIGDELFCPICAHRDKSTEWNTPKQAEAIKMQALAILHRKINKRFSDAAHRTRPATYGAMVRLSLSYKPSSLVVVLPIEAAEAMQSKYACERCGCRYASLGIVFFCPACGHDATIARVNDMLNDLRRRIGLLSELRKHLTQAADKDVAGNVERSIKEGGIKDLVGMFQHFADMLFRTLVPPGFAERLLPLKKMYLG